MDSLTAWLIPSSPEWEGIEFDVDLLARSHKAYVLVQDPCFEFESITKRNHGHDLLGRLDYAAHRVNGHFINIFVLENAGFWPIKQ